MDINVVNDKRKMFSLLYVLSAIFHVFFSIIFIKEKSFFLAFINIVLIICYIFNAITAYKSDDYSLVFKVTTFAMIIFMIIHFIALGPDFEFEYISIATIPLIFYASNIAGKSLKFCRNAAIGAFVLYAALYGFSMLIEYPIIDISLTSKNIIIALNTIAAYGTAITFMSMFVIKTDADVDALEDKNIDLEKSSNIDALTGLRNRRTIEKYINKTFQLAKGEGKDFAFLMCDIDNFKHVNDTYGHDCGDQVLKNIASIIRSEIRSDDAAFRWGGEEILIVVNAKEYIAKDIAERCRKAIEASSVVYNDKEIKVTITIGGASYYQGSNRDELINKADGNLYTGKNNGKNQVVM